MTFDNNEGSRHESAAPRGEDEAIAHVLGPFEDDSEAYDKGVDPSPLTKVLEWTAILLLFGILSMVILQVTTRFSAASFPWTEELARHFLLWL
ncbi:MAG TPA: hypothetical protein PK781_00135, partial [Terrimesophilobacter sp.]|nr:hypothetical protein [Terrimesophilobacter sp.]